MSNLSTLPIFKDFVMQVHTAITKFKENQAQKPGSSFIGRGVKTMVLGLSLFLMGSCNENVGFWDFSKKPVAYKELTQGQLVRHSYKLQSALVRNPDVISSLDDKALKLALANPDLSRADGKSRVWQYAGDQCVLDIYWVENSKNNLEQIHHEFRTRRSLFENASTQDQKLENWHCMQSIIQDRREKIETGFSDLYAVLDL